MRIFPRIFASCGIHNLSCHNFSQIYSDHFYAYLFFCTHYLHFHLFLNLMVLKGFFDNFVLIRVDFAFGKYLKFVVFVHVNVFITIYCVYLFGFDLWFWIIHVCSFMVECNEYFGEENMRFFYSILDWGDF